MSHREQIMINNALVSLDRLYDGDSSADDVQALLLATGEALRGTEHFTHFERVEAELLAVVESSISKKAKRVRALCITDDLRHYLAEQTPPS